MVTNLQRELGRRLVFEDVISKGTVQKRTALSTFRHCTAGCRLELRKPTKFFIEDVSPLAEKSTSDLRPPAQTLPLISDHAAV
jgi:hypothetical protein